MNTNATGPPPPPPMALGDALQHTADYLYMRNTTVMATVATISFVIYDILISLDREAYYVWRTRPRFSIPNILFLMIRWFPLVYFSFGIGIQGAHVGLTRALLADRIHTIELLLNATLVPCLKDLFCTVTMLVQNASIDVGPRLASINHRATNREKLTVMCLNLWRVSSAQFCIYSAIVPGYITSALMIGMDAILVARTWAIYGRSRTVLTILVLGGCLCYIPAMVVFNVEMSKQGITPADAIRLTALMQVKESFMGGANATLTMPIIGADAVWVLDTCFMVEGTKKLGIMFVMSLVYESILFTAMMFQFVRYGTSSSKILENLYHDGMVYFVVILLSHLTGAVNAYVGPSSAAINGSFYFVALKSIMCSRVMLRLRASFAARDAVIDGYHFDIRSGEAAFGNANSDSGVNGVVSEARFAKFVTTMTMTITTTNGILGGEVDEEAWNLGETPAAGASGTIRVTRRHELDWTADDALEPIATPSSRSRSMDEQLSLCRQRTVDETDSGTWLTRARPSSLPIIQVRNPPLTRKRPRSVSTVS